MAAFSSTDAAFLGFRYVGRRPATVLTWAAAYLAYQLFTAVLFIVFLGDKAAQLRALAETNKTDPAAAFAMLPSVAVVLLIALPLALAFWSVMNAAAYRALLNPESAGAGRPRIGSDELHMAGLIILWVLLTIGYTFVIVFLFVLGAAPAAALPVWVRPVYLLIWTCAAVAAFVYPIVRLSLSTPMTVAEGHIRILESWKLTRGRFWPLFGAYLLCWVLVMVVFTVALIVIVLVVMAVTLASGGSFSDLSGVFSPDYGSLKTYFSPARLISLLLNAPVSAAALAIAAGPSVEAYRAFAAPPAAPPEQEDVEPAAPPEPAPPVSASAAIREPDPQPEPEPEPEPQSLSEPASDEAAAPSEGEAPPDEHQH